MKGKGHMGQLRRYRALGLIAITPILSLTLAAQSGDPVAALQQKLNSQFKLTVTTKNLTEIVTAGDVVVLHKDGLKMSALASPLAESSTYKDGKIGGGGAKRFWGSLGVAALQGVAAGLDPAAGSGFADIPGQTYGTGQKFWVLAATAQKDGVLFKLYSDPDDNGVRYHADLKILYPNKKQVPTADAALQLISEVLTVVPPDNPGELSAQGGQYGAFAGEYLLEQSGQRFSFSPDGSCSVLTPGNSQVQCHFTVDGDSLATTTKIGSTNVPFMNLKIQGGKLLVFGIELVRQGVPTAPATQQEAEATAPAPPQHQYEDLAAPQPPPAPAPTISMGQTKAQVTTAFGEPQRKAAVGPKEIFFYTDLKMKVTFTSGKVSSIE
jgi:hypothetical protein